MSIFHSTFTISEQDMADNQKKFPGTPYLSYSVRADFHLGLPGFVSL